MAHGAEVLVVRKVIVGSHCFKQGIIGAELDIIMDLAFVELGRIVLFVEESHVGARECGGGIDIFVVKRDDLL